ncbi:MAG: nucleoside-diphosphate kinase, partial [Chloroflexota bacterium]
MDRTLVLLKPDAIQRGLVGNIVGRLEARGLKIVGLRFMQVDRPLAERHYAVHQGKPFYLGLVDFITSGPIVALALEGRNAVDAVRATMGATDAVKAAPGTIRGDLGIDLGHNLIHGSDSAETAVNELRLFFPDGVVDYAR